MTKHIDYNDDEQLRELVKRSEEDDSPLYEDEELNEDEYEDNPYGESDEDYAEDEEDEYDDDEEEYEEEEEGQAPVSGSIEDSREDWKRILSKLSPDIICFLIFCVVLLCGAAYWTTHYNQSIRKLTEREQVLKDLRFLRLYTTADLVRLERINNIEQSIKKMELDLEFPSQPPYEVIDTLTVEEAQ